MAYGSDVQAMSRSPNLLFKDAVARDYPDHAVNHKLITQKIDLWTARGTHIVGGCEWVDYMYHWDTLMVSHFSFDMNEWVKDLVPKSSDNHKFTIMHAPNHRNIKGTPHIVKAVEQLPKLYFGVVFINMTMFYM